MLQDSAMVSDVAPPGHRSGALQAATLRRSVANDRFSCGASRAFPPDTRAVIRCPAPSAMSSGRAQARQWILEFVPRSAQFAEPLMGWIGGAEPLRHVQIRFPSREAAIAYAQRQGLRYEVQEPTHLPAIEPLHSSDQANWCVPFQDGGMAGSAANDSAATETEEERRSA